MTQADRRETYSTGAYAAVGCVFVLALATAAYKSIVLGILLSISILAFGVLVFLWVVEYLHILEDHNRELAKRIEELEGKQH